MREVQKSARETSSRLYLLGTSKNWLWFNICCWSWLYIYQMLSSSYTMIKKNCLSEALAKTGHSSVNTVLLHAVATTNSYELCMCGVNSWLPLRFTHYDWHNNMLLVISLLWFFLHITSFLYALNNPNVLNRAQDHKFYLLSPSWNTAMPDCDEFRIMCCFQKTSTFEKSCRHTS